jgi:hypothetical protein
MIDIINNIKETNISAISYPFEKDCIESVSIWMQRSLFDRDDLRFSCDIKFKNGNTEGKHSIKGTSFEDCFLQLKAFVENL